MCCTYELNSGRNKRLTPEQRTKKRMGLKLDRMATPISQEEIDIAKAVYFEKGGEVTYLKPSRVTIREIRKFIEDFG